MTSPNYSNQGYSDALAGMYDSAGALQLKEIEQRYKLGQSDISARLKIASQQSKDTRYGIDATRDTAREQIAQARAEMEQIGIPRMLIEKFVAEKNYEIAQAEMTLKRDIFVEETAQAKAKLQLDREQMERIGIPQMEINKYVAEQNAKIAQAQQTGYFNGAATLDRQKFQSDADYQRAQLAQSAREFQTTASGYMQQQGTLAQDQRLRYEQIKMADQQGTATAQDRAELAGYEDILAGRAPGVGGSGGPGQATLEREKFEKQYGLDVAKFGADLASTPDTYFQARRFQGVDVPRLMGGAGAATQDVQGGPTPGVATMGAYLSGQDPYGQQAQGVGAASGGTYEGLKAVGGGGYTGPMRESGPIDQNGNPIAGPTGGGAAPLSPQEQARYQQLVARARELNAAGEPVPAVDADELARFQARLPRPTIAPSPGGGDGQDRVGIDDPGFDPGAAARKIGGGGSYQPEPMLGITDPGFDPNAMRAKISGGYGDPNGLTGASHGSPAPTGTVWGNLTPEAQAALSQQNGGQVPGYAASEMDQSYGSASYGGPTASVYGGPAVSATVGPQGYSMPAWYTQQQQGATSYPSQDPRQKQVAALVKALPPSPYDGLNEQDSAALHGMEAIYKGGGQQIAGGEYERLKASGRLGFMQSAGKLLGYSPSDLENQYKSYRPSQGSSRMAG
jgi:hypothetical protein